MEESARAACYGFTWRGIKRRAAGLALPGRSLGGAIDAKRMADFSSRPLDVWKEQLGREGTGLGSGKCEDSDSGREIMANGKRQTICQQSKTFAISLYYPFPGKIAEKGLIDVKP